MDILKFDVMLNDHFICTLRMPFCSLFVLEEGKIKAYIESKRPTLKGKNYNIKCYD